MIRTFATLVAWVIAALTAISLAFGVVYLPRALAAAWGLPNSYHYFSYHPDEIFLLLPSFYFAQGDWNPHFFNYGTLYIYLVGISALLLHVVPEVARFPDNLGPLYQVGRSVTLWMGIATIVILPLAFRSKDRWTGLLAAALLALCPLHLVTSGYATVDVPATFWITLAFVLAILAAEHATTRWGVMVGLAVGLAAATKYNAALFIVPAVLAPVITPPRAWRWGWVGGVMAGAVLGFAIGCPLFWTPEFRQGLLFELQHARAGGTLAFVDTGNGWAYHLLHGLPVALGYPLLVALAVGVIAAIRAPSLPARLSLLWVVFYLLVIGFGKERFIRYLVPLTPLLCLLAAFGLASVYRLSSRVYARIPAVTLAAAVLVLTWLCGMPHISASFRSHDPREVAFRRAGLHHQEPRLRPRTGLVEAPWFSDPPVSPFNAGPVSARWFEDWNRAHGNRVVVTGWDVRKLETEKPVVFFLSDLESQDLLRLKRPDALAFVAALARLYRDKTAFGPATDEPPLWLAPPRSWAPPDWLYQSPRITMYYSPR